MPKKVLPKSPLELRYEKIDPKPTFPLETFKMILGVGLKEGSYPVLWRDRKPNIQQFMRTLHPTCEMCGKNQDAFSHDVHHLAWEKKHDCRYENMFVVCRGDHTRLHRRGWYPSQPWNIAEWGEVPQGLIDRNHLDKDGNAIAPQIMDNSKKSKPNESEHKSKTPKRSRKAATLPA
jgi:hypothetical protein